MRNLIKISLTHVATILLISISKSVVHLQVGCVWYW